MRSENTPTPEQVERGAIALLGTHSSMSAEEAWSSAGELTRQRFREHAEAVLVAALADGPADESR